MSTIRPLAAAAALVCLTAPAVAGLSGPCVPKDAAEEVLARFGKEIVAFGVMEHQGSDVAVFLALNDEGGWTLFFSRDGRMMCAAAIGEAWTAIEPEQPGVDS